MGLPKNRFARIVLVLVVVPAVGGALAGLALGASFRVETRAADADSLDSRGNRHKPIAIPSRACPYLDAVRTTAAAAGQATTTLFDSRASKRTKAAQYDALPEKLAAFDLALRVAATQVPRRLQAELITVAENVEHGRRLRSVAIDAKEYVSDSLMPVWDGFMALTNASDLVGHACGAKLLAPLGVAPR